MDTWMMKERNRKQEPLHLSPPRNESNTQRSFRFLIFSLPLTGLLQHRRPMNLVGKKRGGAETSDIIPETVPSRTVSISFFFSAEGSTTLASYIPRRVAASPHRTLKKVVAMVGCQRLLVTGHLFHDLHPISAVRWRSIGLR